MLIYLSLFMDAHPVMWKGAQDYSIRLSSDIRDLYGYYTMGRYTAIGFHINQVQHDTGVYAHLNRRFIRINTPGSQQNLYGLLGLGMAGDRFAVNGSLEWDWESQRYFTSIKGFTYSARTMNILRTRVGFAPYVSDFNGLNTWLMLEYESNNMIQPYQFLTPLIRLFKGQYLFELGFGSRSFVAIMVHF